MVEVGKYNKLKVIKEVDFGMYLDGGEGLEILLPKRYVPDNLRMYDVVEVFIYHDNEGRIIATTDQPFGIVGEFKFLKVRSVTETGVFLEWGIMKDLLVPFSEQKVSMKEGKEYLVYIHVDHISKRVIASAKIDKYLDNTLPEYSYNQEVDVLVADETDIGYKVIINNLHWGLIYKTTLFRNLEKGTRIKGYIKEVREDEKIDVSITPLGYQKVDGVKENILNILKTNRGFLPLHDKSDPEEIYALLQCSKKSFKQAIGALYKEKKITLEKEGIRLI